MNQARKIRTDPKSTSQYTSNRTQLPNKTTTQRKQNITNASKTQANVTSKSFTTTNSTKVNAVKRNTQANETKKTNSNQSQNGGLVSNKVQSKNSQTRKSQFESNSKLNSRNPTRIVTTKTNETEAKKVIETKKVFEAKEEEKEADRKSIEEEKINSLLKIEYNSDRSQRKFTQNSVESIAAEPPSISEHEVDISDPILNENHSLIEEDEYNYGSDEFESEYASDFEDASNDNSEVKSENKEDEYSDNESDVDAAEAANSSEEPQSGHQSNEYFTKETTTIEETESTSKPTLNAIPQENSYQSKPVINKRVIDLSEIIKLNTVDYNIYDNAPINYDVFMQLFGRKNRRQVYIQSKDLMDVETQTDHISTLEKSSDESSDSHGTGNEAELNPFSLLSYLQKATPKVLSLIEFESDSVKEGKNRLQIPEECKRLCTKFYKLSDTQFVKSAEINHVFCDSHYLFAVQNVSKLTGCTEKSIISVWLNCNTHCPEVTLIARSHIQCLTHLNSLVVAGMIDGSIALWDLKEAKHYHKQVTVELTTYVLRTSSFSTAGTTLNVHENRIVAIERLTSVSNESSDQIATIDETGLLVVWVIVDTVQNEVSFSESAEGMMPGSRFRLTKLWTFSICNKKSQESVTTMKCRDESTFIVGLNSGLVLKYCTYEPEKKVTYRPSNLELQLTPVATMCVHPTDSTFLVSYKAGYICLFSFEENVTLSFFAPKYVVDPIDLHWFSLNSTCFVILESVGYFSIFNTKDQSVDAVLKYKNECARYTCVSPFKIRDLDCLAFGTDSGVIEVMHFKCFHS